MLITEMKNYVPLSEEAQSVRSDFYHLVADMDAERLARYFMFGKPPLTVASHELSSEDRHALVHNFLGTAQEDFAKEFHSHLDYLLDKNMSDESDQGVSL